MRLWFRPENIPGKGRREPYTCESEEIKRILERFIPKKTYKILVSIAPFKGITKYEIIKRISKKEAIPPSTIKFILNRLQKYGLIICNGKVEITERGKILIKFLGGIV